MAMVEEGIINDKNLKTEISVTSPHNARNKIVWIIVGSIIAVSILLSGSYYYLGLKKASPPRLNSNQNIASQTTVDHAVVTPTPILRPLAPTATLVPIKIPLFQLSFHAINYSLPRPTGEVVGAKVRLYSADGKFLGEKVTPATVMNGNIGTGGDVTFEVPLGSYKAEATTEKLKGTTSVTIKTFKDQQYYGINMTVLPMTLHGKYFYDQNKNTSYDAGEEVFANKKINGFLKTDGQLYSASSTTTDNEGNFSLTMNSYAGSFALGAEQVSGYQELPQRWVDLSGGENIQYDIYVWPL